MRRIFADIAFEFAHRALDRAKHTSSPAAGRRLLALSRLYGDAECWLMGLGTWHELRGRK